MWFNHLHRTVLLDLCLHLANYLVSLCLTGPRTLSKMGAQLFVMMNPTTQACGYISTLTVEGAGGWQGLPFLTPKKPSCACIDREVFPDLRNGDLISLL